LDLSTVHLPNTLRRFGTRDGDPLAWGGAVVVATDYGFLLWVPDEPLVSAQAEEQDLPDVVLKIQLFARRHGCDYVLFDADGPTCDGLDTWEEAAEPLSAAEIAEEKNILRGEEEMQNSPRRRS